MGILCRSIATLTLAMTMAKIFEIQNQAKSNPHINTRFVGVHEGIAHLANLAT